MNKATLKECAQRAVLTHKWNLSCTPGGMHHAHFEDGGGWCVYDDWVLALRMLRRETGGRVRRAMMIDLDVHQVRSTGPS